jgi:hypothetical protein
MIVPIIIMMIPNTGYQVIKATLFSLKLIQENIRK